MECNNESFAQLLLQHYANPRISISTPLLAATMRNQTSIMKIFLEQYDMDPNESNHQKFTPLNLTVFSMCNAVHGNIEEKSLMQLIRIILSSYFKQNKNKNPHLEQYIPSAILLLNAGAVIENTDFFKVSRLINYPRITSLFKNHMIINAWLSKNRSTPISLQKTTWFRKMTTIFQKKPTLFAHRIFSRYPLPQEIIEAKINMK